MKRKVKKFAGDEGSVVRTRSDKEFEEDSKFGGYGRYMPKTKEYTLDEVKEKVSGLFGGKKEDTSKFDELESVKKTKTLEEQIGRKATPKASEQDSEEKSNRGERAQTSMMPKGNYEYKGPMPEASDEAPAPAKRNRSSDSSGSGRSSSSGSGSSSSGSGRSSSSGSSSSAAPKADKKADKKADEPKADKKADAPKAADTTSNRYPAILEDKKSESKSESKAADKSSSGSYSADRYKEYQANNAKYQKMLDSYKSDKKDKESKSESTESGADKRKKLEAERKSQSKGFTEGKKGLSSDDRYKSYKDTNEKYKKMLDSYKGDKSDKKAEERKSRAPKNGEYDKTSAFSAFKKGGKVKSASARADGIAIRGKTRA
jgi:hypothetical protein